MTGDRSADQIIAGIIGPAPTARELAECARLLQNYAFDLQEVNEHLAQQLREAPDMIKTLQGIL
jgi:hypothetical protein